MVVIGQLHATESCYLRLGAPGTHCVGPRNGLDVVDKSKASVPAWIRNPNILPQANRSYNDLITRLSVCKYVGVLISLWLFIFAARPKEFFLDGLKKLEQRSHK
jgi:hypothetical protein